VDRKKLTLLRPLLGVRRREIDAYLEARRIPYREDASNKEPFTPRNRLRSEIIPLLQDLMTRDVIPAIVRAAESSLEDQEALDELLLVLDLVDPQDRLFLPKLRKLPEALQRRALFLYLKDSGISDLSRELIERCLTLIDPGSPARVNLPGGLHCCRRAGRILVE
jgi:tRNA(Ile)-lysidine synthase